MTTIDTIMALADEYRNAVMFPKQKREELRTAIERALTPGESVVDADDALTAAYMLGRTAGTAELRRLQETNSCLCQAAGVVERQDGGGMTRLEKDEVVLGAFTHGMQVHVVTINAGTYKVHVIPSNELTDGMKVLCAASNRSDDMLAGMARKLMEYKQ